MKKKKPSRFKAQRNAAGQFEPTKKKPGLKPAPTSLPRSKPKSATVKPNETPAGPQKQKPEREGKRKKPDAFDFIQSQLSNPGNKLDRQLLFLTFYKVCGNISKAAELTEINRSTHYEWMDLDPTYPDRFAEAEGQFLDRVRDFVRRRAIDGVPEPLIWQGEFMKDAETGEILTVLKRSDRILELLAQARVPEFKVKRELTGPDGGALKIEVITGVPQPE